MEEIKTNRPLTPVEKRFINREMMIAKIKSLRKIGFSINVIAQKVSMKSDSIVRMLNNEES